MCDIFLVCKGIAFFCASCNSYSKWSRWLTSPLLIFSGVGYMVGSWVASLFDDWRWGIRVTPFFGVVCLLLITLVIKEPRRGEAENAVGAANALEIEATSFFEDLKALFKM